MFDVRFSFSLPPTRATSSLVFHSSTPTWRRAKAGGRCVARSGFDLLIGNVGFDNLTGSTTGDTILIGGSTAHDNSDQALLAILAEWSSGALLQTRVDHLTFPNTGGLNGNTVLIEQLVEAFLNGR